MLATVHAIIGAGIGSLTRSKTGAFAAGVASHAIADALPHKDSNPSVDIPMLAAALTAIGVWKGFDSPEFCGALGGLAPDTEHGLLLAGLIRPEQEIFPTHIANGRLHGPKSTERWSQVFICIASLALLMRK